ncbi:MAG: hypothetical protein KatS3mg092_0407 [Patescibacteria group bacterium]|nr:MAG: hypothetical protein KatS3mg092_0407 [Patescibacteria group bacterium]
MARNTMRKSQVLLIAVMILATVMTVVLSISFQTITETQITKLEEDNKKALAAAESAIEALLNEKVSNISFGTGSLANFSDFTGGATLETIQKQDFTTPVLKNGQSYTFYLANYNNENNSFGNSINAPLEICFSSSQAIELTLIKTNAIKKYIVDPTNQINNAIIPSNICSNNKFAKSFTIPASDIFTNSQIVIVKNLFDDGKIYFRSTTNLPLQGITVSSQAIAKSGVSKKIILFQSYPQIPTEFFYTRF